MSSLALALRHAWLYHRDRDVEVPNARFADKRGEQCGVSNDQSALAGRLAILLASEQASSELFW